MRIEMVGDAINDGDGEAPQAYTLDGVRKQITWSALSALLVDRYWKENRKPTEEEKLLARIDSENWIYSDDWRVGLRLGLTQSQLPKHLPCRL